MRHVGSFSLALFWSFFVRESRRKFCNDRSAGRGMRPSRSSGCLSDPSELAVKHTRPAPSFCKRLWRGPCWTEQPHDASYMEFSESGSRSSRLTRPLCTVRTDKNPSPNSAVQICSAWPCKCRGRHGLGMLEARTAKSTSGASGMQGYDMTI